MNIDIGTTAWCAALASLIYQIAFKPLLQKYLPYANGEPHPFYGLVSLTLVLGVAALVSLLGTAVAGGSWVQLWIATFGAGVTGYEVVKNAIKARAN